MKQKPRAVSVLKYVFLIVLAVVFLFPFAWMVATSLKTNIEALSNPTEFFPAVPQWGNYPAVIADLGLWQETLNTLIMALGVTLGTILLSALAGYAFARLPFFGRDVLFLLVLSTLIIPFQILFVPLYLMLSGWGWLNSFASLIIPSLASPFAIFVFRQFFITVPKDLDDRAIWTGSVTVRDGLAYLFYTALSKAEQAPVQRIGLAVSTDLVHWERHPGNPLLEVDTRWYEPQGTERKEAQTWRDPYVVYAPDEQVYYMFLSARINAGPSDGRGVIGLARSTNLLSWEVLPPVSTPGDFTEMEVPQVVSLDGRFYLLFCASRHATGKLSPVQGKGWYGTHYLVASKLTGPYRSLTGEPLIADTSGTYYAGKLVRDSAGELAFMAWRRWDEEGNFCGGLSNPAAVHVLPDGLLQVDRQQLWATAGEGKEGSS